MSTQLSSAPAPPPIDAVPLRHPGRWLAAALLVAAAGLLGYGVATNSAYGWPAYRRYLFDERIAAAAWSTVQLTVLAMVLAVGLGVALAIMRGSPNPVLRVLSWLYLWVFRGTPVYVQLIFWGLLPTLYGTLRLGVPFGPAVAHLDLTDLSAGFVLAIIGLGLNEAAYLAEIIRAGITSVPPGQVEAATALGMTRPQILRRTVLPQAMRVIIPPTGNEVISMLKTTSLVTAVPYSLELYGRSRDIAGVIFEPIPLLLVAATWYLAITSVLMIAQHYLERHFSRGVSRTTALRQEPHP